MITHRLTPGMVVAVGAALALAGCGTDSPPAGPTTQPTTTAPAPTSAQPATVTIYATPIGDEAAQWEASWASWAAANNITIEYTGDRDFTTNISTKIQGNALPDIAVFAQPGLMRAAIDTGKAKTLDATTLATLQQNFSTDWQSYGLVDDQQYAVPLDASAKGYIWYSPKQFAAWGVSVPTSWAQLMTLTETIVTKTGQPAWCAGFSSGDASGWPGTDQLAEYVLSASGGEVYDQWVAGDVKFTDPPIADAFSALGAILLDPRYVNAGFGDVASINSTAFGDVAIPLADGRCALTNQATFLQNSFTDAKTADGATPVVAPDGDIWAFMMPPVAGKGSVMGGGDFAVAFADRPEVAQVMNFLASAEFANALITVPNASFITANQGADPAQQANPLLAEAMTILADPTTTFRFGAGDTMPGVVQQAWWRGTTDWINGTDQATVLEQIQAAWADA